MRYAYSIIFGICIFFSCTKSKGPLEVDSPLVSSGSPTLTVLPDSIYFVDIADTTIKSIFSYFTYPGPCAVGLPGDTQVVASFDLDGDLVNDISFKCENFNTGQSASVPCANYHNSIWLKMINPLNVDSILVINSIYPCCDTLALNDNISSGMNFGANIPSSGLGAIRAEGPAFDYNFMMNKDTYIGIKLTRSAVVMYGWLLVSIGGDNSITFKAYALNRRNNNDIAAGQTF